MAGVNKVILVGNLGDDPESRSLRQRRRGGQPARRDLARPGRTATATARKRPNGISVAIFNENLGRVAKSYLRKGSKVYLEGQIQTRKWQDQSGADRYTTEIVLQKFRGELVLLDAAKAALAADRAPTTMAASAARRLGGGGSKPQSRPQPAAFDTDLDDDVPF